MARRGVREGDRVALILPSGLEYLVAAAAASALGRRSSPGSTRRWPRPSGPRLVELVDPKSSCSPTRRSPRAFDPATSESRPPPPANPVVRRGRHSSCRTDVRSRVAAWQALRRSTAPLNRYPTALPRWCSPRARPACPRRRRFTEGALSPPSPDSTWAPSPTGGAAVGPMFVSTQFAHVGSDDQAVLVRPNGAPGCTWSTAGEPTTSWRWWHAERNDRDRRGRAPGGADAAFRPDSTPSTCRRSSC
jgi:hypothetical protein